VYAVDPEGKIRWTYVAGGRDAFRHSSPAIARDGTIYVGGVDRRLRAINPDGSLKWTLETNDGSVGVWSPAIGTDGTIYFGSNGRLYAVRPDGTTRWNVGLFCPEGPEDCWGLDSSPSIGRDGTIYVQSKGLYAVDPDGSIRWSAPGVYGSGDAILGADGTIYLAGLAPPGRWGIYALDSQGRRLGDYPKNEAWTSARYHRLSSPIIGFDGSIVVSAGNELVSIVERNPTNGGYAASPWPQARGDRANSGRARR
jgi:outer membrane protein assembly factor BamB